MIRKGLVLIPALMLSLALLAHGQTGAAHPTAAAKPASMQPAHAPAASAPASNGAAAANSPVNLSTATPNANATAGAAGVGMGTATKADCVTGPCDYQPPKITVASQPAMVMPWLVRDQITWAANLVLVLLGYVGIMMAVSVLKKIERQTRAAEEAAEAARAGAEAALMQAQAMKRAERPWVMVAVEPAAGRENSFAVVAVNRGRSAAQIEAVKDQAILVMGEENLPATPQFPDTPAERRGAPVILLPGESLELKRFAREDVKELCGSEDRVKRVEDWQERIYLYGRILYTDLAAVEGETGHETGWCCWYIHGRQKSGLVPAGPAAYRVHR
jgi:hypothetical protein